jgi:hypothetical protein
VAWLTVFFERCALSGRGHCVGLNTRPRTPAENGVSECDPEAPIGEDVTRMRAEAP